VVVYEDGGTKVTETLEKLSMDFSKIKLNPKIICLSTLFYNLFPLLKKIDRTATIPQEIKLIIFSFEKAFYYSET